MTGEHKDEIGMDPLDRQLLALGEAALPAGFDNRLKSFSEMMAAIEDLPVDEDDELDDAADREVVPDELVRDAFELGQGFLDQGDLDRAELWLGRAARYGHSQAEDKLADLVELRTALADIDLDFVPASWPQAAWGHVVTERLAVDVPSLAEARESAQAIIDGAHRRAESIIALAELRAERSATNSTALTEEARRSVRLWLETHGDADVFVSTLTRIDKSRSVLPLLTLGPPGTGRTFTYSRLARDAMSSGHRLLLVVNSCAAVSQVAVEWSRLWRERVAATARTGMSRREDRSQDELLQLYEFAGGDVDGLRRTPGWQRWTQAIADSGRRSSPDVDVTCRTFTRTLMQHFDVYGLGKAMFDLVTTDAGGLMVPDAWLEQPGGLVVPSDLHTEPVAASARRG